MELKNRLVHFASQLCQSDGQLYKRTCVQMLTYFRSLQRILTLDYTARLRNVNPDSLQGAIPRQGGYLER